MTTYRKPFFSPLLFVLTSVILLTACQKEITADLGPAPATAATRLTSIYDHVYDEFQIDSLTYNKSGYVSRLQEWRFDTTAAKHLVDSLDVVFSFSADAAPPSSYTLSTMTAAKENHLLFYDGTNRLIKDSLLNGTNGSLVAFTYSYGTGYITSATFIKNGGGVQQYSSDTSLITAGNITSFGSFLSQHLYTYNNYPNPCYNKTIAASQGPVLSEVTLNYDFYSLNAETSVTWVYPPAPNQTAVFTLTLDANGRVIKSQQVGKDHFQTFQYNK
jgi:hypothetical protein